jgi:hypothetical protein
MIANALKNPKMGIALITFGFGLFRLVYASRINLSPQEAYYWVWSLHPDLSYFDHPPLVAYAIWLSKVFLGNTELAVRLPAVLFGMGSTWLIYLLGCRAFSARAGLYAALLLNLIISFSLTFLFITPDAPLLFFWCLTLILIWEAVHGRQTGLWVLAGAGFGLALLSKYTALFLGLSTFIWLLWVKEFRPILKTRGPWLALLAAFIVFSPVLLWNYGHEWVSFLFQSRERAHGLIFSYEDFLAFVSSQAGVMTPLVFLALMAALINGLKRVFTNGTVRDQFLLAYALPLLVFFTFAATQDWVKVNWLIPAYPPLIILLAGYYLEGTWRAYWIRKIYLPLLYSLTILLFILLHALPFLKNIEVSGSVDTLTGWPELAGHVSRLKAAHSLPAPPFIFAWSHKNAAELQFYLPGREEVYTQNVVGEKGLAYDFWFDPGPLAGRNALFVWSDLDPLSPDRREKLIRHFEAVQPLPPLEIYRGSKKIRAFQIHLCLNYRPPERPLK